MPTVSDWNWVTVLLNRALLGRISTNVRLVSLDFGNNGWMVRVYLQADVQIDRDDIVDAIDDFDIDIEDIHEELSDSAYSKSDLEFIVESGELNFTPRDTTRVIYSRKE